MEYGLFAKDMGGGSVNPTTGEFNFAVNEGYLVRNGKICESSLAYSVRRKCDRNLAKVNGVLRRDAQVRAEILPRDDGAHTLRLILDDDKGNIMTLDLLTVSEEQAGRLAEKFRTHPERLYDSILQVLLETEEEG